MNILKKGKKFFRKWKHFLFQQTRPEGKVIISKKLEDLKSMFNLIPKDCLPFNRSLVASNSVEDDIEGFDDLDFEVGQE